MSTVVSSYPPAKSRWVDLEEEEDDVNWIRRIVDYKFDGNSKVKFTTAFHIRKLSDARLSKSAIERRSWPKFSDAVHEDVSAYLTVVSTEEILLEHCALL